MQPEVRIPAAVGELVRHGGAQLAGEKALEVVDVGFLEVEVGEEGTNVELGELSDESPRSQDERRNASPLASHRPFQHRRLIRAYRLIPAERNQGNDCAAVSSTAARNAFRDDGLRRYPATPRAPARNASSALA